MFKLCVEAELSAAHHLRDYAGPCKRMHGHNWKIKATVGGKKLEANGMVMDLMDVHELLETCLQPLDHQVINEVPPFDQINPTSENLAKYVFEWFQRELPTPLRVLQVEVFETEKFSVIYTED